MNAGQDWRQCFQKWPAKMARIGLVVTNFDEQIPFCNFAATDTLLLLERKTPDSLGARKVIVPYVSISAVKFTEVLDMPAFEPMGFRVAAPGK